LEGRDKPAAAFRVLKVFDGASAILAEEDEGTGMRGIELHEIHRVL
jgi:hypothetical protein